MSVVEKLQKAANKIKRWFRKRLRAYKLKRQIELLICRTRVVNRAFVFGTTRAANKIRVKRIEAKDRSPKRLHAAKVLTRFFRRIMLTRKWQFLLCQVYCQDLKTFDDMRLRLPKGRRACSSRTPHGPELSSPREGAPPLLAGGTVRRGETPVLTSESSSPSTSQGEGGGRTSAAQGLILGLSGDPLHPIPSCAAPAPDKDEEEKEEEEGAAEDAVESDFLTEGPSHIGFDMTDSFDEADPPRQLGRRATRHRQGLHAQGAGLPGEERVRFLSDEAVSTKTKRRPFSVSPCARRPRRRAAAWTSLKQQQEWQGAVPQSKREGVCSPSPWRDAIRQGDRAPAAPDMLGVYRPTIFEIVMLLMELRAMVIAILSRVSKSFRCRETRECQACTCTQQEERARAPAVL